MSRQLYRIQAGNGVRTATLLSGSKIDERVVRILCSASTIGDQCLSQANPWPRGVGVTGRSHVEPPRTTFVHSGLQRGWITPPPRSRLVIPTSWSGGGTSSWPLPARFWLKD